MSANYIVLYSQKVEKLVDRLPMADRKALMRKVRLLEDDPFYPSLRCKQVLGNPGYYEFSVNMDLRAVRGRTPGRIFYAGRDNGLGRGADGSAADSQTPRRNGERVTARAVRWRRGVIW
jgi:mRNA interferase RelE/StbE